MKDTDKKTAAIFILTRMNVTAVLYFLRKGVKLHFYSLGTAMHRKWQVSRGMQSLWLWVSNRGEKHPCWHTILLAKSSVLYFLRPLTLKRGCLMSDRNFSETAEQEDFAHENIGKRELGIGKIVLFVCR